MSGLNNGIKSRKFFHFDEEEKRSIVEDYLQSGLTKKAIWKKYTGRDGEHGSILRWMHEYGYLSCSNQKSVTFVSKNRTMDSPHNQQQEPVSDFENLGLKKRISELEKQLHDSEMKSIAWQTMIELAEREFNISIKKKFNTQPFKK